MAKVMLIANDGRGHVLARLLIMEGHGVHAIPGSWGMEQEGAKSIFPNTDLFQGGCGGAINIYHAASNVNPDLIIATHPETSEYRIVDRLIYDGHTVFGATKAEAVLETSKYMARMIDEAVGLRHPDLLFEGTIHELNRRLQEGRFSNSPKGLVTGHERFGVVKVDGLAHGLGVMVCRGPEEAQAILSHLNDRSGGRLTQDTKVLVEERIDDGIEISFGTFFDGHAFYPLYTLFEHKRLCHGDGGPLTAEMGSAALPGVSERAMKELFYPMEPFLKSTRYRGLLDVNTFLLPSGEFRVIEWTVRCGDPTVEICLPLIDEPVYDLLYDIATCNRSRLNRPLKLKRAAAVGVIIAGGGYPYEDAVIQGLPIHGDPFKDYSFLNGQVFCMGVKDGKAIGGRHLACCALGETITQANGAAVAIARQFRIYDSQFRTDIGLGQIGCREHLLAHEVISEQMAELLR